MWSETKCVRNVRNNQNKLQDKLETQSEINDSAKRRQYKKYGMKDYNELKSNI